MRFALSNNERIEPTKGAKGFCPCCGAELVAKCGEIKRHHWAHKKKCDDHWWENETDWHRNWKNQFPKEWQNYSSELLLPAPAFPTANYSIAQHAKEVGIAEAIQKFPLLGDSSGNVAWKAWYQVAGMDYVPSFPNLTMLDSNSRVQAVIDGQGIALWDDLISPEINAGLLYPLTDIKLENAGYYVVFPKDELSVSAKVFLDWLIKQE